MFVDARGYASCCLLRSAQLQLLEVGKNLFLVPDDPPL